MIVELNNHNYKMSLLAYSFLGDYERDDNFFVMQTESFPLRSLPDTHNKRRLKFSKEKLAGWCRGLVNWLSRTMLPLKVGDTGI